MMGPCDNCRRLEAEVERLTSENAKLTRAWQAKHAAMVEANAEAKFWFERYHQASATHPAEAARLPSATDTDTQEQSHG